MVRACVALGLSLSAVPAAAAPGYDADAVCSMASSTLAARTTDPDDRRAWDAAGGYFMATLLARYADDAQLKAALALAAKQVGDDPAPWVSPCLKKYLDGTRRFKGALGAAGGQ